MHEKKAFAVLIVTVFLLGAGGTAAFNAVTGGPITVIGMMKSALSLAGLLFIVASTVTLWSKAEQ